MNWKSIQTMHDGFPLMLRYREDLNIESLRKKYANLIVVKHILATVSPNGLPDSDYNESLFEFDDSILNLFHLSLHGVPVLIEPFAGKRNYYFYADSKKNVSNIVESLKRSFPKQRLTWTFHSDAEWGFLSKYSKSFNLNSGI